MSMNKKIIVVGASAASMAFIAKLRSFDKDSDVICISGETYLPYNRCHIASFLTQEKSIEQITLQPQEFFVNNAVDLRLGQWVTDINCGAKTVTVDGVQTISYDTLFLGIGTSPVVPAVPGITSAGVHTFHTLHDGYAIQAHHKQDMRAVVVGAGINGIEAAHALQQLGAHVTVVDQAQMIMPNHLMPDVADKIRLAAEKVGIVFMLGFPLARVSADEQGVVQGVELSDGAYVCADMVVVAVGCRVNRTLVERAGLQCEQGSLVVNERLQTSDGSVYAGGDICLTVDMVSKKSVKSATWADAMLAGLCAATQFSDKPRTYPGALGMRDSHFFGRTFYACGQTVGCTDVQVVTKSGSDFDHYFYLRDGFLVGFVLFGKVEQIGQYKQWYSTKRIIALDYL